MTARKSVRSVRRVHISADGSPYTVWQRRTRILSLALAVWSILEIVVGAGLHTLLNLGVFDLALAVPGFTLGVSTVISGAFNLLVACSGLWGAHDPRKITVFFWAALVNAVLAAWQSASLLSLGQLDITTFISLCISLIYATCGWQVRTQTGYFDKHPYPEESSKGDQ